MSPVLAEIMMKRWEEEKKQKEKGELGYSEGTWMTA